MKRKKAQKVDRRIGGLAWLFGCPQASYSKVQIGRIFEWEPAETESQIRMATIHGQLHGYREHVINLFAREEVIEWIAREHPATADEMATAIIMSGYRDACIPAVLFVRILRAAAAGKTAYALAVADQLENLPRFRGEPAIGSIPNPKYPPPHTPRVGSARPDLSNELQHLRTRIRRGSAPIRSITTANNPCRKEK